MQRPRILSLALLAALAASGCAKSITHTLTVKAKLNEADWLTIDQSVHDEATLKHGDRLRWTCDCPEGATFEVRNIRHLAIGPLSEDQAIAALDAVQSGLAPAAPPYNPGDPFRGPLPQPMALAHQEILSPPYRQFDDEHLWKFDWVVRLEGHPDAVWDPHFSGHKRKR